MPKNIVVVTLRGGVDSAFLYTSMPNYDLLAGSYRKVGSTLGRDPQVLELGGHSIGMPVDPLAELFRRGVGRLYRCVGDPEGDRSHFQGEDRIMSAASGRTGVLGALLDGQGDRPSPAAITNYPDQEDALLGQGHYNYGFTTTNPRAPSVGLPGLSAQVARGASSPARELAYLVSTELEGNRDAKTVAEYYDRSTNYSSGYTSSSVGRQLRNTARLINSGLPARFYTCRQMGYDTHHQQKHTITELATDLGQNLLAFWDDLQESGRASQTIVACPTEMGRMIGENGSGGTDHGTGTDWITLGESLSGPADQFVGSDYRLTADMSRTAGLPVQLHYLDAWTAVARAAGYDHNYRA